MDLRFHSVIFNVSGCDLGDQLRLLRGDAGFGIAERHRFPHQVLRRSSPLPYLDDVLSDCLSVPLPGLKRPSQWHQFASFSTSGPRNRNVKSALSGVASPPVLQAPLGVFGAMPLELNAYIPYPVAPAYEPVLWPERTL